jgi:Flp pilus assembly protein TadG
MKPPANSRLPCRRGAPLSVHQEELGAALIEFALSISILMTLLIGCMEACLAFYSYHAANEYARLAARYAEVHGSTCLLADGTTSCYMGDNNADGTNTTLTNYLKNAGLLGVSTSNITVKPTFTYVPGRSACLNQPNCNGAGDQVTVTVTYLFPYRIPILPARTLNMVSTSTMTISQ